MKFFFVSRATEGMIYEASEGMSCVWEMKFSSLLFILSVFTSQMLLIFFHPSLQLILIRSPNAAAVDDDSGRLSWRWIITSNFSLFSTFRHFCFLFFSVPFCHFSCVCVWRIGRKLFNNVRREGKIFYHLSFHENVRMLALGLDIFADWAGPLLSLLECHLIMVLTWACFSSSFRSWKFN